MKGYDGRQNDYFDPEPPQPEPDDIIYALTVKDMTEAAADIATYTNGEWTQEEIAGALYRSIERTVEAILKAPGKQIMESKTAFSEAFWTELKKVVKA